MITVTNPRVAGFSPRWRSFHGFTLLFDNPGDAWANWQGYQRVACDVANDPALKFYQAVRSGLDEIGLDLLLETYLFCPLAPASYHVTAWDCANDDHLLQVNAPYQPELARLLAGLPATLAQPNTFTEQPLASELISKHNWKVRFRFDRLYKWANVGMVVVLKAANEEAAAYVDAFTAARSELNHNFHQAFGIKARDAYLPHLTLGYFANLQAAQLATPCVDEWSAAIAARVGDLTLEFDRISLYGFTDLENFFKNPA